LISVFFLSLISTISSTLVDGIVTLSWAENEPALDRFLMNNTYVSLTTLCVDPSINSTLAKEQIKKKTYQTDKDNPNAKIHIRGKIGRIVGCLPLQSDPFLSKTQVKSGKSVDEERQRMADFYNELWNEMEYRTFAAHIDSCQHDTELFIDEYSKLIPPRVSPEEAKKLRKEQSTNSKGSDRRRRQTKDEEKSPLSRAMDTKNGRIMTWADGYYVIEIEQPDINDIGDKRLDVDVIVSMKNPHGGYITADEYPALVFYGVMCGIYALFALLWFIWCAFYWRELLKIQFWIGGVILIGMIEKSAFVAEYDTVNRHGYKVHFAIVTAEVLSCFKRTVSRMLVIIVALGYGIVKPRLGSLKQKVLGVGILYFAIATTEALLRLNTKNDEADNRVFISRLPLAVIDATIYYWIFTGLVGTTRTLRLKNNVVKLNVYRHFTNTIIFAIFASSLFMVWSLKSHFFTICVTNWREFWVDDAFWHILFSFILLVIMFLFRPSNNNQRYAFVPLLDHSDNDDDEFGDDEDKGESAVFDSVTMRKANALESGNSLKSKKQQQAFLSRESNVTSADGSTNGTVEDALNWVETNIPTSLADQALQALDSEDEIVNTKLERSKMQ